MRKGLNITTSSQRMFDELDPLKCPGDHVHQPIEGSTHADGQSIARSAFSEVYPRRFARRVAKTMLKKSFPKEKPTKTVRWKLYEFTELDELQHVYKPSITCL